MDSLSLAQAAERAGISASYINMQGEQQAISSETQQQLLAAMGGEQAVHKRQTEEAPVPNVKVFTFGSPVELFIAGFGKYHWQLQTENGVLSQGDISSQTSLMLADSLAQGYHCLVLTQGEQQWQCRVIVAPRRCYEPDALLMGKRLWGACIQLYTLRSEHNWGVGDFGDLNHMLEQVEARGGSFIGLNPVHALYPADPQSASPYSPSSRRWLNLIYIDVNRVDEFKRSEAAQAWWHQPATQNTLARIRASEWVDYPQVMQLKLTALRLAFPLFLARDAQDIRLQTFHHFVDQGGSSLYQQAAFDALHAHLTTEDATMWGWPVWPEPYRDGHSDTVAEYCREHEQDIHFYLWLQWLAACQFDDCFRTSQSRSMALGLYRDVAVGVAEGGAETWCDRELYCLDASVGAPPDILGPLGQNWGLPPMNPHVLEARAYQPFIDLLRANMASCGALRIDHVMSLLRLWWIPHGRTADYGAYVKYPVDTLLAILALESQRHQCMVIGEDLGIVPPEIIDKLRDSGVYSYKVLYFEHDHDNTFRAPQSYPVQAMATITTHDLPTLRGYWQSDDLTLGSKLGLYPDPWILKQLYLEREQSKQGLLDGLHHYHCVPESFGDKASSLSMSPVLNGGLQYYIADSASALLGLQPEDWLNMATPVNIPGTTSQYPNWRRKLTVSLEEMFADNHINLLLKEVDRRRNNVTVG